jgi:hypothetical protein
MLFHERGGTVGGHLGDKGTHLDGTGEKRLRLNVGKPSQMIDSFCKLFRCFPVISRLSKEIQMFNSSMFEPWSTLL